MSLHAVFTEWNEIGMNQKLIQKNTDTYTNTDTEPDFKQSHSDAVFRPSYFCIIHNQIKNMKFISLKTYYINLRIYQNLTFVNCRSKIRTSRTSVFKDFAVV